VSWRRRCRRGGWRRARRPYPPPAAKRPSISVRQSPSNSTPPIM
jgi:hypothetical protein